MYPAPRSLPRCVVAIVLVAVAAARAGATDPVPLSVIPPGSVPIVRAAEAAATLYTVPTGRRLHIVSASVSGGGPSGAGVVKITADVQRDAVGRTIVAAPVPVNGSNGDTLSGADIPVAAGGLVKLVNGMTSGTVTGGFFGWESTAPPGESGGTPTTTTTSTSSSTSTSTSSTSTSSSSSTSTSSSTTSTSTSTSSTTST